MVGRWIFFWDGLFSQATLVSGSLDGLRSVLPLRKASPSPELSVSQTFLVQNGDILWQSDTTYAPISSWLYMITMITMEVENWSKVPSGSKATLFGRSVMPLDFPLKGADFSKPSSHGEFRWSKYLAASCSCTLQSEAENRSQIYTFKCSYGSNPTTPNHPTTQPQGNSPSPTCRTNWRVWPWWKTWMKPQWKWHLGGTDVPWNIWK